MWDKDTTVFGVLAGVLGGTAYQGFVWIFYLIRIAKITPYQIGAYVLIKPGLDITSFSAQLLGMVQHYANSALLAIIALYLLRLMGTDYAWLKGLSFGGVIYFLLYGVIAKAVVPVGILQPDLSTSAVFMFGNLIFGLVTVLTLVYYSTLRKVE
ncbi:MAG: hypothetical protein KGZ96_09495 [Clostridia bacterium]|nr:hypothetical protein [Clostridia bacterium]